jgi:hypothetical protein
VDVFVFDVDPVTQLTSSISETSGTAAPSLPVDYLPLPCHLILEPGGNATDAVW